MSTRTEDQRLTEALATENLKRCNKSMNAVGNARELGEQSFAASLAISGLIADAETVRREMLSCIPANGEGTVSTLAVAAWSDRLRAALSRFT